ncbi:hypothetical protein PYW08_001690 [Mythimna loreyi]|uniref:Uncharacterized protein n=1 Tax=Mythimna loreyi TaxID=667449 RepID=A0ACC2R6W1_9NEOP|nr:hypothetical protein PYW08_001690 [Mythimna loreyi]
MAPKDMGYIEWAHKTAAEKKTHVSFPQLKYPSQRDGGLKDSVQWLEGKAMDDGAEGLWRIRNGLYDLTEFMKKHPGGEEWLELSQGTDITEAFESHHLNPAVDKVKEKYYVRDALTPRNSPFTFEEDGFYKSLKRSVIEELKKIPPTKKKWSNLIIDGLFLTCLIASALSCWATDYWVMMVSYLVASFALTWTTIAAHNYIHRRSNWRMYLFNISLMSYREFRVSHALSHHLYPNTLMDLEISGWEPIFLWNPRKKPSYAYLTPLIELVVFPLLFIMTFTKRFIAIFIRKGFFKRHYRWHDGIGLLHPIWMYLASGSTFYHALTMWLWINFTASFIFLVIAASAAHHNPKIFKDGDQLKTTTVDWGLHTLETVMDRRDINSNYFTVLTFFGDHALHHLFPTLDHALLNHLYPVFLKHCEEFRANYRLTSQFDSFIAQLKMAVKEDPTPLDE